MVQPHHTQIIATLGPASNTYEQILALHRAGVDFFRLNFSHGSHEDHARMVRMIHQVRLDHSADIGILADLQGPKIRIGKFQNDSILLQPGQRIRFDQDTSPGDETRVNFPHPDVIAAMEPGYRFLLDDGNVAMKIEGKGTDGQSREFFVASVLTGTKLSNRKGVNVPDLKRPIPAMTPKDKADLEVALGLGVDWVAVSFVQSAADVAEVKRLIEEHGNYARVIAKIEKPDALQNIDGIIAESDAIMVARGDLAVEFKYAQVPAIQRALIHKTRSVGKPVIVATQMLESMITNERSTRAENTDVANAVFFRASAVMLSGETASGQHPVRAVQTMRALADEAEAEIRDPAGYLASIFGIQASQGMTLDQAALLVPRVSYAPAHLDTWRERRNAGQPVPHNLGHLVHERVMA
jgi:pyruvate kinase